MIIATPASSPCAPAIGPARPPVGIAFFGGSHSHAPAKVKLTRESPDWNLVGMWDDDPRMQEKYKKDGVRFASRDELLADKSVRVIAVESGVHTVELRKRGKGPLYYNGYLTNFTLEDHITKAGLELKVNRKYYRLDRVEKKIKVAGSRGQAVDQAVEKYERVELRNLSTLKSGDLVEIELEIDSKNDYEYLVFEDMKAAGFEPVEVRSGYSSNGMRTYMELRDERVTLFARRLARGKHSVNYRMRAEIPGSYSALPTKAYAMYAPELKGNSDEMKISIVD